MKKVSARVVLNCSVEVAFDFINDQKNHATLNKHNFHQYTITTPDSIGTGVHSRFVLQTGAFRETGELTVTGSDRPHRVIEEGRLNEGKFKVSWELTPLADDQTELEITTEYMTDNGLASLMSEIINRAFVRIYTRLLTELAARLNQLATG